MFGYLMHREIGHHGVKSEISKMSLQVKNIHRRSHHQKCKWNK
jgi:hypothetical protein